MEIWLYALFFVCAYVAGYFTRYLLDPKEFAPPAPEKQTEIVAPDAEDAPDEDEPIGTLNFSI